MIGAALICAVTVENWSPSAAFCQRIRVLDQKPAHDVLAQLLRSGDVIISSAPSLTELYLGRPADFGLRENRDRDRQHWRPFTPQEKSYYSIPFIDRPDLLERVLTRRSNRVWLYANVKLLAWTSPKTKEIIFKHFNRVYPPELPSASVLLLKQ